MVSDCLVGQCRNLELFLFFLHHMVSVLNSLTLFNKIHQKVSVRFSQVTYPVASIHSARSLRYVEYFLYLHRFLCMKASSYTVVFFVTELEVLVVRFLHIESPKIPSPDKEHNWRYVLTSEMYRWPGQSTSLVFFMIKDTRSVTESWKKMKNLWWLAGLNWVTVTFRKVAIS